MATLLHIEDDAATRQLVGELLTGAGHEVVHAETGLQGIRMAESERPDLVLLDINTRDLDGYAVTLRLRGTAGLEGTPIVAITAEGDRETSLAVGADGHIDKPIDEASFVATVERFLSGHSERREGPDDAVLRKQTRKIVERLENNLIELIQANERLEEVARLRREFLQNLSHEFATPMTPVVGYLRLLLDEELGPLTPLQRKCLESVNASTKKLRALIDTLLDVSHLETGRLHIYERDYDFAEVTERALDESAELFAGTGITLLRERPEGAMAARGDPEKLRRALIHVLDNAAKFTPRGQQVAAGVRRRGDGALAEIYEVVVVDSGPGISESDRERILQPFFQADGSATRSHGGVGLGLAFARHVSEAMGGGIQVISPPDIEVAGRKLDGTAVVLSVHAKGHAGVG
ncbi:MAG: hybrid sensor histidine kinase/response regulator [Myxococcales bacterium]|nr:hybrid sensor histidine kinase/response regulator [Myxococcales bacterium]